MIVFCFSLFGGFVFETLRILGVLFSLFLAVGFFRLFLWCCASVCILCFLFWRLLFLRLCAF